MNLIVHLTHSRPPPPWLGRLVAGRGIVSCPGVAVDGGGTGESAGIAGLSLLGWTRPADDSEVRR
jgi:hypothetical protein